MFNYLEALWFIPRGGNTCSLTQLLGLPQRHGHQGKKDHEPKYYLSHNKSRQPIVFPAWRQNSSVVGDVEPHNKQSWDPQVADEDAFQHVRLLSRGQPVLTGPVNHGVDQRWTNKYTHYQQGMEHLEQRQYQMRMSVGCNSKAISTAQREKNKRSGASLPRSWRNL